MFSEVDLIQITLDIANGDKYPLAKLITEIEKENSLNFRKKLFEYLEGSYKNKESVVIGFTGTPGAGKSSLISVLTSLFLEKSRDKKLAIVAIDPSSSISGGSILGDRTRMNLPVRESRVFFRSQPNQLELGGLNPSTYHVVRLLRYFFDIIIIETVGIGQNEIEVSKIADFSFLIMQPLGGDQIQFMKSGIMEVPDAFIMNKCDEEELANLSFHSLQNIIDFTQELLKNREIKIFKTSVKNKTGIDELLKFLLNIHSDRDENMEKRNQLDKWIKSEFGNYGLNKIRKINLDYSLRFEILEEEVKNHLIGK